VKAIILAAGRGTRLMPLTSYKPKPLLIVGGRPLLEWMLLRVRETGIKDVLIVTNYLENQIIEKFGDGKDFGLNISYLKQENMLGTANAFGVARKWVGEDDFVGLYGDHFLSVEILKYLIKSHKKGQVTVSVLEVEDPSQFGVISFDGDIIKEIVEKPKKGSEPSTFANVGVYIFPSIIFDYIDKTEKSLRGEYEITDTMQLMINDGVLLKKHDIQTKDWLDIGLPWTLLEANKRSMDDLMTKIEGKVEDGVTLNGSVWIKKDAIVRRGTYIEGPVVIGEKCDVGPNCYLRPGTCLGDEVRIGNACEVKNSIIMNKTHAAHLSYIGDSIIGSQCNIGAGTIIANLRFDNKNIKVTIKGERLNSGRRKLGAIIGDKVQTGINVSIHPGVIVGNETWIAPGVTLQKDVPDKVIVSLNSERTCNPR
jgi:bifunctional UDP-N-acetylglucosamine pyrophosphorylase/glucosamine-1-phosphate N-acetyltransferase